MGQVDAKNIRLVKVETNRMLADILSKQLQPTQIQKTMKHCALFIDEYSIEAASNPSRHYFWRSSDGRRRVGHPGQTAVICWRMCDEPGGISYKTSL